MTFDQAQGMFRTHRTYETAYTYLLSHPNERPLK